MKKASVILICALLAFPSFAAEKSAAEPKEYVEPKELWLAPIWLRVNNKSGKPKNISVAMRIVVREGYFGKLCPFAPKMVDALNIELNRGFMDANVLEGRKRGNLSLEATKLLKSIIPDKQWIFSVEIFQALPKMNEEEKANYNRCNQLPLHIAR